MDNSLYDKCGCGATKLTDKERCTNCWLDSQNYSWMVESNRGVDHPRTSQSRVNISTNSNTGKTSHSSVNPGYGRASCTICGNIFETYPATKAVQKVAGNALAWGGIGLTVLTGGLTAFVFGVMPGMAGAGLAESAKVHTLCPRCR